VGEGTRGDKGSVKSLSVTPELDTIGTFLARSLVALPPLASLGEVAAAMEREQISSLLVVADGRAVGIVTERDILRAFRQRMPATALVTDFMGKPVLTCPAESDYRDAYRLMVSHNIHHLVLVDGVGAPLGIISESDFRAHLGSDAAATGTRIAAAMTADPVVLPPSADLLATAMLMDRRGATAAIIAEDRRPRGIVTARDIVKAYHAGRNPADPVTEIMASSLITVTDDLSLEQGLRLMQEKRIRRLVVVDASARLAGLLSQSDLVAHLDIHFADVAEARRDRTRRALRDVQAHLRGIFDESPHFIALLDVDGILLEANAAALRSIHRSVGELLGKPFWETPWWAHDAALQQRLAQAIRAAARGERQQLDAWQPGDADGILRYDVTVQPLHDDAGAVGTLLVQAVDITAHMAALEGLRTLSSAVEQSAASVIITDTRGTIHYVNPSFCQITGYQRDEVIGANPRLLNSGRQSRAFYADLWKTITGGNNWHGELCNRRRDGSIFWEDVTISPVRDGNGTLTHFVAVKDDITERRAAAERLRLAASVYEGSHEGIIITDPAGVVVDVNAAYERITGYTREETIGHRAELVSPERYDDYFVARIWDTLARDGIWRGEITNQRKNGDALLELLTLSAVTDPAGKVTHYVGAFADITELKKSQERLAHLAHFDPLTGLPNRSLLVDRLGQAQGRARRHHKLLAIVYLDLDRFAPLNKRVGREIGDQVLIEIADRLGQALRSVDTVARIDSDEFVLLLPDINRQEELADLLTRLLADIAMPLTRIGLEAHICASLGVTLYPQDSGDPDNLIRHAHQSMILAKEAGGNTYHLFDAEHDKRSRSQREVSAQVREAFARGEFELWYQPKVNMREGRVEGAEALLRWRNPQRGIIPPGEFLPSVEDTDFMIDLGNWVLETAVKQIVAWLAKGIDLVVSVNISANHLQRSDFVDVLRALLARYPQLPQHRLEIEILETAALDDMAGITRLIEECRSMGVHFALDDFGTGYSSLAYFRQLPARTLKIDQAFVRDMLDDPGDLAIVEAVIGLTSTFQRAVIAEGVESSEHGKLLLQLGCDHAQGFGIARPMPPADFETWLTGFRPDAAWSDVSLTRIDRDSFQVLIGGMQIRRWVSHLFSASLATAEHPEECDHNQCEFGRWYYGAGTEHLGRLPAFREIEKVHGQMHLLAARYIECGAEPAAQGELRTRIEADRDHILDLMEAMRCSLVLYHLPPDQVN
jgi:diguanylate cyclase (GGDEF)-like protein/PAS domain S-box-containing protein